MPLRQPLIALVGAATALALAACSSGAATQAPSDGTTPASVQELTVVTHDSFALSQELLDRFAAETGYEVTYVAPGDTGTLVNQLVLTKDSPLGDVVFGIDNTFAGRAVAEGVVAPYEATAIPAEDAEALKADDSGRLTSVDFGDVCVNADLRWFAERGLEPPKTLDDLADTRYRDLLVVENPASSSPGLAFLTATVAAKGDPGYLDYWTRLRDNGAKIAQDWTQAYSVDFSGSTGHGAYPLVVSYSTSPAFEVVDGQAPTAALLDTCFRQVEYAGVIEGAENVEGAQKFIEFLLSPEVQADIPNQMYMYPAVRSTPLPEDWVTFAPLSENPLTLTASEIADGRDGWIRAWTSTVLG